MIKHDMEIDELSKLQADALAIAYRAFNVETEAGELFK